MEYARVGRRSKTDIAIAYIEDIANPDLVELIRNKLNEISIDGLPMAEKTIEEVVFGHHWNPYPLVRYTERPDVAAVHLLEGHVLVYVDTSPSVMITPTTFSTMCSMPKSSSKADHRRIRALVALYRDPVLDPAQPAVAGAVDGPAIYAAGVPLRAA